MSRRRLLSRRVAKALLATTFPLRSLALSPATHWVKSRRVIHRTYDWYVHHSTDVFVHSFPKSGRTWLRLMMGSVMAQGDETGSLTPLEVDRFFRLSRRIPRVTFSHQGVSGGGPEASWQTASEIDIRADSFEEHRVVLLVRDPRDLLVSIYFHRTRRDCTYQGDLASYVYEASGSADAIIRYMNLWASARHTPRDFLLLRYEDLLSDPQHHLTNLMTFVGVESDGGKIRQAVRFADFKNMRKMEMAQTFASKKLQAGDPSDPSSYKTRRGVAGAYKDYLAEKEIRFLDQKIDLELDPLFSYQHS